MRPYVNDAAVYVVPLRIGGGTRLKIFEAMAMGKAVVSTTVGAEGLPVENGEHLLLADEPHAFARSVVRLIRDVDRRRALEAAARTLVVDRYDWSAVAGELEDALIRFATCSTQSGGSPRQPQSIPRADDDGCLPCRKVKNEGLSLWSRICRKRVGRIVRG